MPEPLSTRHALFRWGSVGLFALLVFGITSNALALEDSDKEAVRQLSNDAATDYKAGNYDAAREKFMRAYALAKVPRLAVWVARSYAQQGRLVSAYELYRQAIRLERSELWVGDTQLLAQQDAEKELSQLTPRLAKVTVLLEGAQPGEVEVKIDDSTVPSALLGVERLVDPGTREVTGVKQGSLVRQSVTLAEGGQSTVVLKFASAAAASPLNAQPAVTATNQPNSSNPSGFGSATTASASSSSSPQRTWGYISLGVGAVGLVGGAIAGAVVASKYGDLNDSCPNRVCDANLQSKVDSYRTMQTLATVGLIIGGVGTAAGVTLLLTSPTAKSQPVARHQLRLGLAPNLVAVRGTF